MAGTLSVTLGSKNTAQLFALVMGLVYLLIGVIGFSVTRLDVVLGLSDATLVLFALNVLHNLLHMSIGAVWIVASQVRPWARTTNLLLGIAYALLTVLGFAGVLKVLAIGSMLDPDNFLHLATAMVAIYFGAAGADRA
jgi:Domain of unknown function (DUF4383)